MSVKKSHFLDVRCWLVALLVTLSSCLALANADLGFDPGPDPSTPAGKGYIELVNDAPHFPLIGRVVNGGRDKFRYPFGLMPWRGPTRKNSVKILVIGQDGTHIAEAAGRPFTGGTGGRVQNLLAYLGVRDAGMYINTYSYTIYGQYSDWAPMIVNDRVRWSAFMTPEQYMIGQDPSSPIVKWRNDFLDHIIKTNKDSLKLIVTIGGAAADTLATYVKARGGSVPTFVSEETARNKYQMVMYKGKRSTGNRSVFFPVNRRGKNILLDEGERFRPADNRQWTELTRRGQDRKDRMVKLTNGPYDNGILNLAQLGYNIHKVKGSSEAPTGSIQGIKIGQTTINKDIRVLKFKHPGAVSPDLESKFRQELARLERYTTEEQGSWTYPEADNGIANKMLTLGANGFQYNQKPPIPVKDFPLGKSKAVIVNKSLAARPDKQIITFGGRDRAGFDRDAIRKAKNGMPSEGVDFYIGKQPWNPPKTEKEFDFGPGKTDEQRRDWARLFNSIENRFCWIYAPSNVNPDERCDEDNGSEQEYSEPSSVSEMVVKSKSAHGAFGFHRGDMKSAKVIVIADPSEEDLDDMYTARALTGALGQRLHGFLSGLGVDQKYAVVKTLPFDMTGASDSDWNKALKYTKEWRKQVITKLLRDTRRSRKIVLTVGKYAKQVAEEVVSSRTAKVHVDTSNWRAAFDEIKESGRLGRSVQYVSDSKSIPREHLPFPIQSFFGTSGSRGIRATGRSEGLYYGVVVPSWVLDIASNENLVAENLEKEIQYIKSSHQQLKESGFATFGRSMSRKQTQADRIFRLDID